MTKRYSGRSTPAEVVAGLLRQRGFNVDPDRLEDRARADAERRKRDDVQNLDRVRTLATQVKRARRATEVAELMWRMNPTQQHLREAQQAQRARTDAEAVLLEELLGDRALMNDVLRQAKR